MKKILSIWSKNNYSIIDSCKKKINKNAVITLIILHISCYLAIGQSYIITPDSLSYKRNSSNGLSSLHLENGSNATKRLLFADFFMESNRPNFLQISAGNSISGLLFKVRKHSDDQAAIVGFDGISKRIIISHDFDIAGTPLSFSSGYRAGITIDSLGKVGIGTLSPKNKLHILNGGSSSVTPNTNAGIVLDRNNSSYINLLVPDEDESGILFGRPTGGAASGGIIYDATRALNFRTSSNDTRMTITEAGSVGIGTDTPDALLEVMGNAIMGDIKATKLELSTSDATAKLAVLGATKLKGTVQIGTNGSSLINIIRVVVNIDIEGILPADTKYVDFAVPNVDFFSSVAVSPDFNLPDGLIIENARVSLAGQVTVKFYNATNVTINPPVGNFTITVIK